MALNVILNGQARAFAELASGATLADVLRSLDLKSDRVAVELNGDIAARSQWASQPVNDGDRLEIVHFVGGGVEALLL